MSVILNAVRASLSNVRTAVRAGVQRFRMSPGEIVIDRAAEDESMRVYYGVTRLRHSRFHDNFTYETREMLEAYRKWPAEPTAKAALAGKVMNVAALGLQVKPSDKGNPRAHEVADFVRHNLNRVALGFPGLVYEILIHSLQEGWSVCEPVWTTEERGRFNGKRVLKDFKSKDTRYIVPLVDPFRNIAALYNYRGNANEAFDPSEFVIYSHLPIFRNPTGTSDLRAAYRAMHFIPAVVKLRMIFLEKYTGPFLKGTAKDRTIKSKMAQELAKARADGWIVLDAGSDVEAINLAMSGTADFQAALDDFRKEMATSISGAFLQMMTAGDPNARGDSRVQQDTANLFVWWLAEMVAVTINRQLVPLIVDPNYGATEDLPVVTLEAVKPADIQADLGIDRMLFDMKVDTSLEELRDRARRSPPKDPNMDSVQKAAQALSQPPGGPPGVALPDPSGGNPFAALGFSEGAPGVALPSDVFDRLMVSLSRETLPTEDQLNDVWIQALDTFAETQKYTGTKKDKRGRNLCYRDGVRVPCQADGTPHPEQKFAKRASQSPEQRAAAHETIMRFAADPNSIPETALPALADVMQTMTVAQLKQVKATIGVKGGQRKQEHIDRIRSWLVWQTGQPTQGQTKQTEKPKETPKPERKPNTLSLDNEQTRGVMQRVLPNATDQQWAAAACAPPGAAVKITKGSGDSINLSVNHEGVNTSRTITRRGDKVVCENHHFFVDKESPHKGQGYRTFADQVQALAAAGVDRIETYGCGSKEAAARGGMNGYYTWPRLGYDARISGDRLVDMPAEMKAALGSDKTFRNLFDNVPGGAEWWKENGSSTEYTFDLSPGSRSMKALENYVTERERRNVQVTA